MLYISNLNEKSFFKYIFLLILVILYPLFSVFVTGYNENNKTYSIPRGFESAIEIKSGDIVSQEITVKNKIDNIGFLVATGGSERENKGHITISLQQKEIVSSYTMDISKFEDWSYISPELELDQFTTGNATLSITTDDTEIGSSIYIVTSTQNIYEIPAASMNSETLSGPLYVTYTFYDDTSISIIYNVILLFLLLLCIILLSIELSTKERNGIIYLLTTFILFLIICMRYPTFTLNNNAWAEVGINYIPWASEKGFFENLFSLEAGLYLNFLGRIVSFFVVHILPGLHYAPLMMNIISTLIMSAMVATISSGVLKKYISSIESIIISILLFTCLVDGETSAVPLQMGYWGIIPIIVFFIALIGNMPLSRRQTMIFMCISILCVLSKMSFVILIPTGFLLLILLYKYISKKAKYCTIIIMIFALIQGMVSEILRYKNNISGAGTIKIPSLFELINGLFYYQVQIWNTLFPKIQNNNFILYNIFVLALILFSIIFCFYYIYIKKKYIKLFSGILLLVCLSFSQSGLVLLTDVFSTGEQGINWNKVIQLPMNRTYFFSYVPIIVILIVFFKFYIEYYVKNLVFFKRNIYVLLYISLFFICSFQSYWSATYFTNITDDTGEWNYYYKQLDNNYYYIPISPLNWAIQSNSVASTLELTEMKNEVTLEDSMENIFFIYVKKEDSTNQLSSNKYYIKLYDKNKKLIKRIPQINSDNKNYIGFYFSTPLSNIKYISFTYDNDQVAYISSFMTFAQAVDINNGGI